MNSTPPLLLINEVFPNPNLGSEWIEIYHPENNFPLASDFANFTISDDKRVIYSFSGEESWSQKFLVVEVSGLNNDGDSVILKDAQNKIIDEMTYNTSQKNLSWLRSSLENNNFVLGEASPLEENLIPIPISTVFPSPTPIASTIHPSSSLTPTPTPKTTQNKNTLTSEDTPKQNLSEETQFSENNSSQKNDHTNQATQELKIEKYFSNYQNPNKLKLNCKSNNNFPNPRLVFLGQKILKSAVLNAIIGSCLLFFSAVLLSYEQKPKI